jgi:hypothetical protein
MGPNAEYSNGGREIACCDQVLYRKPAVKILCCANGADLKTMRELFSSDIVETALEEAAKLHGHFPVPWSWALLLRTTESPYRTLKAKC